MAIVQRNTVTDALLFISVAQTNTAAIELDACLTEVFASAILVFTGCTAADSGCAKVFV